MGQTFTIDININGAGGTKQSGGQQGNIAGGAAAGAVTASVLNKGGSGLDINKSLSSQPAYKQMLLTRSPDRVHFPEDATYKQTAFAKRWKIPGLVERYEQSTNDMGVADISTGYKESGAGYVNQYMAKNGKKIGAIGIAAAWKIAGSVVDYQNYTSGDSHENAQRSNAMKLASYGAAIAVSGPLAPLLMAGIAVGEGISAISQASKYNYDRQIEKGQIYNMEQIAGNISYGRGRGAL